MNGNESMQPVVFPGFTYSDGSYEESSVKGGLTIRQHFAAMAMQGLLSNQLIVTGDKKTISVAALAESATHYADALIAELNKIK